MIPHVSPELRDSVARALKLAERSRRSATQALPYLRAFAPDFEAFHEETAQHQPRLAAVMTDEDGGATPLPVLLQPDPLLISQLEKSRIPLKRVEKDEAEKIMIDRVSEFLSVRSRFSGLNGRTTTVNSRRKGDTILFCKGYFLSTATAFGVSTPAHSEIAPGRYTFGIGTNGANTFDGVIWTCPTIVRLDLP